MYRLPRPAREGYDTPMPSIVSFRGWSNTGKTTLITALIRELTNRGYRVSAMKGSHKNLSANTDGGDSLRFATAGALGVGLCHSGGMNFFLPPGEVTTALLERIFPEADFILAEGLKASGVFRIITAGPALTLSGIKGTPDEWDLVVTEEPLLVAELDRAGISCMPGSPPSRLAELLVKLRDNNRLETRLTDSGLPGNLPSP